MNLDNETRILIRDIRNGIYKDEEIDNIASLRKCDRCPNIELKEDLKHSINDDYICESCLDDVDI